MTFEAVLARWAARRYAARKLGCGQSLFSEAAEADSGNTVLCILSVSSAGLWQRVADAPPRGPRGATRGKPPGHCRSEIHSTARFGRIVKYGTRLGVSHFEDYSLCLSKLAA
ncbi:hypothetical protein BD311DRAFT_760079 [Dichomitus squalens]|uniref:Uncharacterized protein n=1 Tax=Dichomitus squalens TaxID=114155 RepID=A0A4Q9MMP4_9APHY|nr:hypothetical protein BD311DRAFT_760079 [Dichomitus squalens]